MSKILLSENVSKMCSDSLKGRGYELCLLPAFSKLSSPVASHVDMLMCFDGKQIITHSEYYKVSREIFDSLYGIDVVLSDENISDEYPGDVLFNGFFVGDMCLVAKSNSISRIIKKKAKEIIGVKQGYASCSVCKVSDRAFITSDKGIADCLKERHYDVLMIEKGYIALPPYDYGFIGGASVVLDDEVCFFGSIEEHPDYAEISRFIKKNGKKISSLSNEKLCDIGGGIVIKKAD